MPRERWTVDREPSKSRIERDLPLVGSNAPRVVPDLVGQAMLENRAEPGPQFNLVAALEVREVAIRLEEGLLDQVGRVDLGPQRLTEEPPPPPGVGQRYGSSSFPARLGLAPPGSLDHRPAPDSPGSSLAEAP